MNRLTRLTAMVLAGLAWRAPIWWLGPLAALVLPLWGPLSENKRDRFVSAVVYFASGSVGLVPGSGVFFGHGAISYLLGAGLWAGSAALLALPWAWADGRRPWTIIVAMAVDVVPPLGLFGWLSPLTAAGIFWPGAGLVGLGLFCLGIVAFHVAEKGRARPDIRRIAMAATIVLFLPVLHGTGPAMAGGDPAFVGVDTDLGPLPADPMAVIARNENAIAAASKTDAKHSGFTDVSAFASKTDANYSAIPDRISAPASITDAKYIVLPETVAVWLTGTANQYAAAVPPGQTWLVGATTVGSHGRQWDSIVAVHHDRPGRILFRAAFPVPVSMWHPWKPGGYGATWSEPVRTIAGRRVAAVICYDQLLVWPWLEAAWNDPQVVLAVQNEWWARGTGIPVIQRNSAKAWSRLAGARAVFATNW